MDTTQPQSGSLTKLPHLAHMAPLCELLATHGMIIQKEEDELAKGRQGDNRLKRHQDFGQPWKHKAATF